MFVRGMQIPSKHLPDNIDNSLKQLVEVVGNLLKNVQECCPIDKVRGHRLFEIPLKNLKSKSMQQLIILNTRGPTLLRLFCQISDRWYVKLLFSQS
jgi:hypothetical protein